MQGAKGGFPHRRSTSPRKAEGQNPHKDISGTCLGQISKLSTFLHFQLPAPNIIPLTDFTQYFYCALSLCLDKSEWLAQSKHLHWGEVHSGLNEYTVGKKANIGEKLAQFSVTILFTSHHAPNASHMHPISTGVSVSSLALKLLG